MNVVFGLRDVFNVDTPMISNARVLRALLDTLIVADEEYLRNHSAPRLYSSHVRYGRTNEWESIPDVMARGTGDCKSLSAWLVAEKRVRDGQAAEADFRWMRNPKKGGIPDWHIVVRTSTGVGWEDPSKVLGMNMNENAYMGGSR